jgi:hypothetical protein
MIAVDMAEAELTAALVMMVGGTRLTVSASQVLAYLKTFFLGAGTTCPGLVILPR